MGAEAAARGNRDGTRSSLDVLDETMHDPEPTATAVVVVSGVSDGGGHTTAPVYITKS